MQMFVPQHFFKCWFWSSLDQNWMLLLFPPKSHYKQAILELNLSQGMMLHPSNSVTFIFVNSICASAGFPRMTDWNDLGRKGLRNSCVQHLAPGLVLGSDRVWKLWGWRLHRLSGQPDPHLPPAVMSSFYILCLNPVFVSACFSLGLLSPTSLFLENPWPHLLAGLWSVPKAFGPVLGQKLMGHPSVWIPYIAMLVTELPQLQGQPSHNFLFFSWRCGADRWVTPLQGWSLGEQPTGISESWICQATFSSAAASHLVVGCFWWNVSASMGYCFPGKLNFIGRQLTSSFPNKLHQIIWCYQQQNERWQKI